MVNIQDLFDDAKCYQTIRDMRWPDGVACPHGSSTSVIKDGRDDTELHRQRSECQGCHQRFDDLTDTIFASHHQPLRTWIACFYLMGLNLSGLRIAQELDINKDDARAMLGQLRQGIVDRRPPVELKGEGGTLAKEKPPIFGMIQRGGEVVIRMLENVKQVTLSSLIERTIAKGTLVYTDEYDIYSRLVEWGHGHKTVCHAAGEYARDEDGDEFCEVHVNTLEGFWSLPRSWLRPHRGIPQASLSFSLGFLEFAQNVRVRGKRLLSALIGQLVAPTRNPS